jgi:hypothetical protein
VSLVIFVHAFVAEEPAEREYRLGRPRLSGLDKLPDPYYVLGHTFDAPEHQRQPARRCAELNPVVRGLLLEFSRGQYFAVGVADDQVRAEDRRARQHWVVVKYRPRQAAVWRPSGAGESARSRRRHVRPRTATRRSAVFSQATASSNSADDTHASSIALPVTLETLPVIVTESQCYSERAMPPNSLPWTVVTPLRRENSGSWPPLVGSRALPGAAVLWCGGAGSRLMFVPWRGGAERLWSRSFADVVRSLAGLTPSNSLTPGADLQGR